MLRVAGLLGVAALAARVARRAAEFVVRIAGTVEGVGAMPVLVRVAWIAILGPVAHTLVALAVRFAAMAAALAAGDDHVGHRDAGRH